VFLTRPGNDLLVRWILFLTTLMSFEIARAADIAIDVGHTLLKPGVISATGIPEIEYNRKLALTVAQKLEEAGISTHLINADGNISSLGERTTQASRDRYFISIHHDSVKQRYHPVTDPQFKGFSLWVSQRNADFPGSVRCASLIADQLLRAGFQPSHYHADPVLGENRPVVDWQRGIFTNNNLLVLATARGAAVLVEAGVIANPAEEAVLSDPVVFATQAQAIASGLERCVSEQGLCILAYSKPSCNAAPFGMRLQYFMRNRLAQEDDHRPECRGDRGDGRITGWIEDHQFAPIAGLPVFIQVIHRGKNTVPVAVQYIRMLGITRANPVDGVVTLIIKQPQEQRLIQSATQQLHPGEIGMIGTIRVVQPADDIAADRMDLLCCPPPADPGSLKPHMAFIILTTC
jgi:N-acetylmuramoyl-L-alanine amidase